MLREATTMQTQQPTSDRPNPERLLECVRLILRWRAERLEREREAEAGA